MSNDIFGNFDALFEESEKASRGPVRDRDVNQFMPGTKDGTIEYKARLRFIPCTGMPMFVKKVIHVWKENSRLTIREVCPKTKDPYANCPICEQNIADHRSGNPELKKRATQRANKTRWIMNILVINDEVNPQNNGKVMYWEMPDQIKKMIDTQRNPPNEFIESVNVFHPLNGADFFLNMKRVGDFDKYDASMFNTKTSPMLNGDIDAIKAVLAQGHDIAGMIKIKTEDELVKSFARVMVPGSTERTFNNVFETPSRPAPSVGGLPPRSSAPVPVADEFDAVFEAASAPKTPAPTYNAPAAPAARQPHESNTISDDDLAWMNQ